VSASTRLPDGTTVLPPVVAGSVFGTYTGTTVGTCARAAWGAPVQVDRAFPFMISACAWRQATSGGTAYTAPPSPSWDPPASEEDAVSPKAAGCDGDPSSAQGDFALLLGPGDLNCRQTVRTNDQVSGLPASDLLGSLVTGFCEGRSLLLWLTQTLGELFAGGVPKVIYLPVYDQVVKSGTGLFATYRYHVSGFAAFEPTGAVLGPLGLPSWRTGRLCGLDIPCLRGFFTRKAFRGRIAATGEDYGVYALKLVG
jgi:hypothetical protein